MVLGYSDESLRLHLCLSGSGSHHHHLLRSDDPATEERPPSVRFQGEGQKPEADNPHGPGGGSGFHHLLDPHSHLHHREDYGAY